jgi:hypothetical protein
LICRNGKGGNDHGRKATGNNSLFCPRGRNVQNGTDKQAIADNLLHHGSGGCAFKCGMADIPIRTSRGTPAGASLFFYWQKRPAGGLAPKPAGLYTPQQKTAQNAPQRQRRAFAANSGKTANRTIYARSLICA